MGAGGGLAVARAPLNFRPPKLPRIPLAFGLISPTHPPTPHQMECLDLPLSVWINVSVRVKVIDLLTYVTKELKHECVYSHLFLLFEESCGVFCLFCSFQRKPLQGKAILPIRNAVSPSL